MEDTVKKILANNILEFLIDPTKVEITKRVYFGPNEHLDNSFFEKAKENAYKTYRDERHNSDTYPGRNCPLPLPKQGALKMDRKSIIASLDILSKNFKEDDVIAVELRTMATAVAKMDEEVLKQRLSQIASETTIEAGKVCKDCGKDPCECKKDDKEASDKKCKGCGMSEEACSCEASVEAKAATFKCPKCGTNVLEKTGYCVKCKAKVKKATIDIDFWPVEASTAVMHTLVADVEIDANGGDYAAQSPMPEPETNSEPDDDKDEEADKEETPAPKEDEKKKEIPQAAKKATIETVVTPEVKPVSEIKVEAKKEESKKEKEDSKKDESKKADMSVVNTDVLASYNFGGIEMDAGLIMDEDVGALSVEEKTRLEQLF